MAEFATIARPYADALFKACAADAHAALGWLDALASIAADDQLQQFANNPRVTAEQVYSLITDLVKTPLDAYAQNFLRTVIANNRLVFLPEIAQQFRVLANTDKGLSDAVVYSAFPIEGDALSEIARNLEKRFARKLNLTVMLQPELIGGIRVVVGDEVLDTSVKARLEQMKVALTA